MRQRQPDGAELLAVGRARIQNAPCDIQMRFGVPIVERVALPRAPPQSDGSDSGQHPSHGCDGTDAKLAQATGVRTM